jgi:hypothetical protein
MANSMTLLHTGTAVLLCYILKLLLGASLEIAVGLNRHVIANSKTLLHTGTAFLLCYMLKLLLGASFEITQDLCALLVGPHKADSLTTMLAAVV